MPEKSTVFCNYIVRLHYDEKELKLFRERPDERIRLAGLTVDQGAALKSKDVEIIWEKLREEQGLERGDVSVQSNGVVKTLFAGELKG